MVLTAALLIPIAYLLGSLSGAISLGRIFYGVDVRDYGSKNPGSNNVQRVFGWPLALFVFIFDILKGVAASSLVFLLPIESGTNTFTAFQIIFGLSAVLGHIFPIFHQFKGGKGVATLTGVLWAIHPFAVLFCFSIFLLSFITTRYISLSAIVGISVFPLFVNFIFGDTIYGEMTLTLRIFSIVVAITVWLTHISNILRLLKGKEEKFKLKRGRSFVKQKASL